jgi:hypothetical protein
MAFLRVIGDFFEFYALLLVSRVVFMLARVAAQRS